MTQQPKIIKQSDSFWLTLHSETADNYNDDYYTAVELMDSEPKSAEKIFKKIISACGNGHLDAILHLGLLYNDIGKETEGNVLITKAHKIAVEAFPDNFNSDVNELHWGELDNRPILRSFHAFGIELMKEQNYEQAIKEFNFILKLNPNDNQGIRYLIADCLLQLDKPKEFLELEKQFKDDYSVEFFYGKFLALYLLDKKEAATKQLKAARKSFPYVAEELVKTKHIFPADEFEQEFGINGYGYPDGSRQQAFDYWRTTEKLWEKAKDIKKFIAETK